MVCFKHRVVVLLLLCLSLTGCGNGAESKLVVSETTAVAAVAETENHTERDNVVQESSVVRSPGNIQEAAHEQMHPTLAEKIQGAYLYQPYPDGGEEEFHEEYAIEFYYISGMLLAEIVYQMDHDTIFSRQMAEFVPVEETALTSTTETGCRLTSREFSGFSMAGNYWGEEKEIVLTVVEDGLMYRDEAAGEEILLTRSGAPQSMHGEEALMQCVGQIAEEELTDPEALGETGVPGRWYGRATADEKEKITYLEFDQHGLMWLMRKIPETPIELYRGAYGVAAEGGNTIYVFAERCGYPSAPLYGIWHAEISDDGRLLLNDRDEYGALWISRSDQGAAEFSREK